MKNLVIRNGKVVLEEKSIWDVKVKDIDGKSCVVVVANVKIGMAEAINGETFKNDIVDKFNEYNEQKGLFTQKEIEDLKVKIDKALNGQGE